MGIGRNNRKGIVWALALLLALSPLQAGLVFGASLGDPLADSRLEIGQEIELAGGVYWNTGYSEKIAENYVEYRPGGSILPRISYGNDIVGAASFRTVATMEAAAGRTVVAGINGDFFNTTNGVAAGLVIKDGLLRTSESAANPSVGFRADGSAVIGRPGLNIRADGSVLGSGIGSIHLNKIVTATSGVMLYTTDFGDDDTNKAPIPTYNVLLDVASGELRLNGLVEATVSSVGESAVPASIPQGKLMLSMSTGTAYPGTLNTLRTLNIGDTVFLSFTADPTWNDVVHAVGAGEKLVTAGAKAVPAGGEIHPRTALGIRSDGSQVLYTVDGRIPDHSKGATLDQLADRLLELGCVEAVNLDGGGSTALHAVYPGDASTANVNRPAQAALRNCANYILLTNSAPADGVLANLHVYPFQVRMLAGATQVFTAKATDRNYYAVAAPGSYTYSASSGLGTFSGDGIFTAGTADRTGEVTLRYNSRIAGTAAVTIVSRPDSIALANQADGKAVTSLSATAGATIDLAATALWKRLPLVAQDRNFTWTVDGNIGTVDANGVLTVAKITSGTGTVTAAAGGTKGTVAISVVSEGTRLETFENGVGFLANSGAAGAEASANTDRTRVRYGIGSASIRYDFRQAGGENIFLPAAVSFARSYDNLALWIYGDKSGNRLDLVYATAEGNRNVTGAALDFDGWRQIVVPVPAGAAGLTGIALQQLGNASGTIYLDQVLGSVGYYVDTEPPTVSLSVTGQSLTAVVADGIDGALSPADMRVTYDGALLPFTYDNVSRTLTATLPPLDNAMHRVAVTAADRSGNLNRAALTLPGTAMERPFPDMAGHWAEDSTSYLYGLGIVNGKPADSGLVFRPDDRITRAEFAVVMANWLGDEATGFESTVLPFADAGDIPSWSVNAAKAMYALGIVRGVESKGSVYFHPASPISREEVMTIIGRTQERGFAENDLAAFADGTQVSAWAQPYVRTLVQQGIVSGYDNKLWPKNPVTRAQVATIITNLN